MPDQHDDPERQTLLDDSVKRFKSAWIGFRDFALRDNVLEVAVGLVIAAAFTTIVNSLVSDILLPPISLLPILDRNLPDKFAVLRRGLNESAVYNTLKQAHDDGAITLNYGIFVEKLINFFGLGLVLYGLAHIYALVAHEQIIKYTTKCINCRKEISVKAKRCAFCTSWQDNRENK